MLQLFVSSFYAAEKQADLKQYWSGENERNEPGQKRKIGEVRRTTNKHHTTVPMNLARTNHPKMRGKSEK
jgi:hypothetical protein